MGCAAVSRNTSHTGSNEASRMHAGFYCRWIIARDGVDADRKTAGSATKSCCLSPHDDQDVCVRPGAAGISSAASSFSRLMSRPLGSVELSLSAKRPKLLPRTGSRACCRDDQDDRHQAVRSTPHDLAAQILAANANANANDGMGKGTRPCSGRVAFCYRSPRKQRSNTELRCDCLSVVATFTRWQ